MKPADFFVSCNTCITAGHNLKSFKPQCSLDVQKYSFAYRIIDIWNSLSSDIINVSSISVFKHELEFVDFTPFDKWIWIWFVKSMIEKCYELRLL